MEHVRTSRSNRSREVSDNGQSHLSSTNRSKSDAPSVQTQGMISDVQSSDTSGNRSFITTHKSNKNIRLIPLKVKDVMQLLQSNPEYKGKSPVMLNVNENSIDKIIQQQQANGLVRRSPMSLQRSSGQGYSREQLERTIEPPELPSKPPLGAAQNHQVFAMHDIQAYPMIGESGFRVDHSPRIVRDRSVRRPRRDRSTKVRRPRRGRSRVRREPIVTKHYSRPRRVVYGRAERSPRRNRSRTRRRNVTPRRHRSRPRKVVNIRRPVRSVMAMPPRYPPCYDPCCTPYPLCDNDCYPSGGSYYPSPRYTPDVAQSGIDMACTCTMCQQKLQFIQPSVCPKKKYMWTNEYAIIPKPQVNLIDPCDELDPTIYPRAENPCIRDSHGNPLTDCIGRPLRDPIGKRFLKFGANGSVMNTNFRGNFYTGQPPLCVKCPMPDRSSCAPDTTHNYWMSCGYPIMPNMNPYFQQVVANEHNSR